MSVRPVLDRWPNFRDLLLQDYDEAFTSLRNAAGIGRPLGTADFVTEKLHEFRVVAMVLEIVRKVCATWSACGSNTLVLEKKGRSSIDDALSCKLG